MMPAGFVGGHGTAAAIGGTLVDYGWNEALTIGNTFATLVYYLAFSEVWCSSTSEQGSAGRDL